MLRYLAVVIGLALIGCESNVPVETASDSSGASEGETTESATTTSSSTTGTSTGTMSTVTTVTTVDPPTITDPVGPDFGLPSAQDVPDFPNVELEGTFLLAVATTLSPNTPLQFIAELAVADGLADLTITQLSLDVGSVDAPREPVGEPRFAEAVAENGEYEFFFPELEILGEANPITGSDILANVVLLTSFSFGFCGEAEGQVLVPLDYDLAGSQFGSEMIDTGPLPPVPFAGCAIK